MASKTRRPVNQFIVALQQTKKLIAYNQAHKKTKLSVDSMPLRTTGAVIRRLRACQRHICNIRQTDVEGLQTRDVYVGKMQGCLKTLTATTELTETEQSDVDQLLQWCEHQMNSDTAEVIDLATDL